MGWGTVRAEAAANQQLEMTLLGRLLSKPPQCTQVTNTVHYQVAFSQLKFVRGTSEKFNHNNYYGHWKIFAKSAILTPVTKSNDL